MSQESIHADVDTAIIFTHDMHRLARFYQAAFGLGEPTAETPGHIGFKLPSLYLGFDQIQNEAPEGAGGTTLWFRVDDLDAAFERLVGLGAEVRYAPVTKPFGDRVAAVYDVDGNMVGLSQR